MTHLLTILPHGSTRAVPAGGNLLQALREAGCAPAAPCGGTGKCGKCTVLLDGVAVKACTVAVDRDMTVTVPKDPTLSVLTAGIHVPVSAPVSGCRLAFDIGTTTVAGVLLAPDGRELGAAGTRNPQAPFGADVVSRIRAAQEGHMDTLTAAIRACLTQMALALCEKANISPEEISLVSLVGNPAMQQLFLGISPKNLARPPFSPVLRRLETVDAHPFLPCLPRARLLILPNISGFVGADTLGCMVALGMDTAEETTLLVDIGTNGEMVLGNRHGLISCSTAAGPALEGAHIQHGMSAGPGAIDRVHIENGSLVCRVIGGGAAGGICGSGLISAVAAALDLGLLNNRGKILDASRQIPLAGGVSLSQEDIRQVQLAKGAVAAGIGLLVRRMGITPDAIGRVYLAGAFGSYLDPEAACRMGLLPREMAGRIEAVGNAALSGARLLALDPTARERAQVMAAGTKALDLSAAPDFPKTFAQCMRFDTEL